MNELKTQDREALSQTFVTHYHHLGGHLQAIQIVKAHPSLEHAVVKLQLGALYQLALFALSELARVAASPIELQWVESSTTLRAELEVELSNLQTNA